ncbi:zinc finger protein weckle-like [Eurosta solidaginis]|uniref:zinc finger protein weckle-like n=1 Tax=Eurosta solidaginis TaxID=178769 RepID=UPI0035309F7F
MSDSSANCSDPILGGKWRSWCRLCAKADARYINVITVQSPEEFMNDNSLKCYKDLANVILDFLRIHIKEDDKLPQVICSECHELVISLIKFSERANKVQQMFADLQNSINKSTTNLQMLLENYGINSNKDETQMPQSGIGPVEEIFVTDFVETAMSIPNKNVVKNEKLTPNEEPAPAITKDENKTEFHDPIGDVDRDFDYEPFSSAPSEDGLNSGSEDSCMDISLSKLKEQSKQKRKSTDKIKSKSTKKSEDILNKFLCQICPEHFKRRSNYSLHMKKKHGVFNCANCVNAFKSESELKQHMEEQHRKLWNCLHCEQAFEKKGLRSKHMLLEHKIKYKANQQTISKLVCEVCGEAFVQKKQLKQHVLTHTDYEPLNECKVCGKTFKWKYTLKKHLEIHGDKFICTECGKQLSCRATLNNHMLVHSDAMKHKCDVCGRLFKRAKTLKYHLIAHTGLRPYSCDFCGKTFSTGSSCRFHKKTMHPNELAQLEASGAIAYTKNVPNLDELRAVARTGSNFRPLMSKQNGYVPKS